MMISGPLKYSVSSVVGFIKGKSAIHLARPFGEQMQNHLRQSLLARYDAATKGEMPITSSAAVNSHAMRGFLALSASSSAIASKHQRKDRH
jgi:hypothetical protein